MAVVYNLSLLAISACSILWAKYLSNRSKGTSDHWGTDYDHRFLLFAEAVDVFVRSFRSPADRNQMACNIATALNVKQQSAEHWLKLRSPEISSYPDRLQVGRVLIPRFSTAGTIRASIQQPFAMTTFASRLLESIGACVDPGCIEPVLLVGETGTGKTTIVQHLAQLLGVKLHVVNLSQQSDSSDLLGGFRPLNVRSYIMVPLKDTFDELFSQTFSVKENTKFLEACRKLFGRGNWQKLICAWQMGVEMALKKAKREENGEVTTRIFLDDSNLLGKWNLLDSRLRSLSHRMQSNPGHGLLFGYVEGILIKAIRSGDWVLLDEVNLASTETLECLMSVLDGPGSVTLFDRGDDSEIPRHKSFRLFACMNPSTDVGKKDLPLGLRNRMSEFWVGGADEEISVSLSEKQEVIVEEGNQGFKDVCLIIGEYLSNIGIPAQSIFQHVIRCVARAYLHIKFLADQNFLNSNGTGVSSKPHFSIRSLSRALSFARQLVPMFGYARALYEGLYLTFCTVLDGQSLEIVNKIVMLEIFMNGRPPLTLQEIATLLKRSPAYSPMQSSFGFIEAYGFVVERGSNMPSSSETDIINHYIKTPSVNTNLKNVMRALLSGYPILLQGPTSAGKTSMIEYLAALTNHRFVRVNNHEHTDVQEYIGTYIWNETESQFVFQEGVLVQALRNGWWVALDELNLAPTDVLEALNRLLDDNKEIYIAETGEIVKPAPGFMLFATQNPAGTVYGGRKFLSRAFRNRFVEVHFSSLPTSELETILEKRCQVAPSYATKMVRVFLDLQKARARNRIFDGKESFMTLRDLFRWGNRKNSGGEQPLGEDGYLLLAERTRSKEERSLVQEALEKHLRCKINPESLYENLKYPTTPSYPIVWTKATKRLFALVHRALAHDEPVLLVGETGCGKTTVLQVYAEHHDQRLHIVNCHQHSETADFIGSMRPSRREQSTNAKESLFEWKDGPLVQALRDGDLFLLDEISLAEDSVLERLNSVLESSRLLVLAEKSSLVVEEIRGRHGFQFLATMNPAGDFGKKELSPALRNRFTEIWIESAWETPDDLSMILMFRLHDDAFSIDEKRSICTAMLRFMEFLVRKTLVNTGSEIWEAARTIFSLRDILTWVDFMNECSGKTCSTNFAFIHGCTMVFLDAIGMNQSGFGYNSLLFNSSNLKSECIQYLVGTVFARNRPSEEDFVENAIFDMVPSFSSLDLQTLMYSDESQFKLSCFGIPKRDKNVDEGDLFAFSAPTTFANAMRILRAMQLPKNKPILLEGSPGVGKTSLVNAIANAVGRRLVRINLSEQTDLMDLFGSDLPVESCDGTSCAGVQTARFAWREGPLLRAMKQGDWVLLDELNLANQSVLEGLNACLDHRSTVFIPEIDRYFKCHPEFRVFGAQNPLGQGGGRKGLPKSFLNRFTRVYVDSLNRNDLMKICCHAYPNAVDEDNIRKMILFNEKIHEETMVRHSFGIVGRPWEFNLRDVFRWLDLLAADSANRGDVSPRDFVELLYIHRMRTEDDRKCISKIYEDVFGEVFQPAHSSLYSLTFEELRIGFATLPRQPTGLATYSLDSSMKYRLLPYLHSICKTLEMGWMPIIVGSDQSDKSEIVRCLCRLLNRELVEMPMNQAVDSMDLVGGFEQRDPAKELSDLKQEIESSLHSFIANYCLLDIGSVTYAQSAIELLRKGCHLKELEDTLVGLANFQKEPFMSLSRRLQDMMQLDMNKRHGAFSWVDGVLVDAIENGKWALIDNANLCSPSVLDRLNSLVERNGTLMISEHGLIAGQPRIVHPHPEFRLILTVNVDAGCDISRAMRNRGVEIAIIKSSSISSGDDRIRNDLFKTFLNSGMPSSRFCSNLLSCFLAFEQYQPHCEITIEEVELTGKMAIEMLQRGHEAAIENAATQVLLRPRNLSLPFSPGAVPQEDMQFWWPPDLSAALARNSRYFGLLIRGQMCHSKCGIPLLVFALLSSHDIEFSTIWLQQAGKVDGNLLAIYADIIQSPLFVSYAKENLSCWSWFDSNNSTFQQWIDTFLAYLFLSRLCRDLSVMTGSSSGKKWSSLNFAEKVATASCSQELSDAEKFFLSRSWTGFYRLVEDTFDLIVSVRKPSGDFGRSLMSLVAAISSLWSSLMETNDLDFSLLLNGFRQIEDERQRLLDFFPDTTYWSAFNHERFVFFEKIWVSSKESTRTENNDMALIKTLFVKLDANGKVKRVFTL